MVPANCVCSEEQGGMCAPMWNVRGAVKFHVPAAFSLRTRHVCGPGALANEKLCPATEKGTPSSSRVYEAAQLPSAHIKSTGLGTVALCTGIIGVASPGGGTAGAPPQHSSQLANVPTSAN